MYHIKSKFVWMTLITIFIVLFTSLGWTGTTGKIVGIVTDSENGEPLPGVNIVIEGQPMGAATDTDGIFLILNLSPGYYDVSAVMVGYKKTTMQKVQIVADRTTNLEFNLETTVLETEAIIVQAERPLIKRDETSKTVVLDFEVFSEMPIQEVDEAIAAQAGMVTDEAGDLHLRGGRAGEIAYMIDGVLVQDPFYKSGASSVHIDKYLIQELQMYTGAFGAEYGQAMSGIINVVTKEGKTRNYSARFEYESPQLIESPYRKEDWMLHSDLVEIPAGEENAYRDAQRWHQGDGSISETPTDIDPVGTSQYEVPEFNSIPGIGKLPTLFGSTIYGAARANLSGPVPFAREIDIFQNLTFFISYRYSNEIDHRPWGYDSRREFNGKLTWRYEEFKINASIQRSAHYYKPYSHVWKYRPFALEDRQSTVDREVFELTHTLGQKSFYTLRLSRYDHQFFRWNPDRKFKISDLPAEIHNDPARIDSIIRGDTLIIGGKPYSNKSDWVKGRTNSDNFYIDGDRGRYEDNTSLNYSVKFDLVNQIADQHELKSGMEFVYHDLSRDRWRYPWYGSAHYVEIYDHRNPLEFNAYIQDKMEYERFVLNIGLRYDYFNPQHSMWANIYDPGYLEEIILPDTTYQEWIPAEEVEAKPQQYFSPRIGISYPVTERLLFHSNYGHFYEKPSFYEMFKHHNILVGGDPLVGNPKIKSEKTVQYEFGVKVQLGENWAFDINAYFKDITNLAASTYKNVYPYNFTVFDNSDYASVKGIDITLQRKVGRFFTGILNYSLSVAKGNESSSREGYDSYRGNDVSLRPNREFYLDFDRRHDLSINTIFKTPRDFGPYIFGTKLFSQWNLNLLVQIASGLPYTPFVEEQAQGVFIEKNTGRKPWFAQVDLRFQKMFDVSENVQLAGYIVVKNLFDRLNTNYVWTRTGQAWDAGPTSSRTQDRIHNPSNVGIPRQISVGFRFLFTSL
jgi:outer membrane receptor protein involved in Fe transport